MSFDRRHKKSFVRQQDHADCGVACLATLIKYYGGHVPLERLRELSGTDKDGTTMLGLFQCAQQTGFDVKALEGEVEDLKTFDKFGILHVTMDGQRQHYVIFYGYDGNHFLISDPERGLELLSPEKLKMIWQSKAIISLQPNKHFVRADLQQQEKWKWFWHLIREDINILGVSLVLGVFISILSLSVAVFSQKLIDEILPNEDLLKLQVGLALLVFLLLGNAALGYIRQYFLLRQSKDFNNRIIQYFFGSLMHLPKSFFDNRKTGDLIARLNDTSRIQAAVSYLASSLLIDVLLVIVTCLFILSYSGVLGLIALITLPVLFIIVYSFHRPILAANRAVMESYASTESNFVDTIMGIGTVKTANREGFFSQLTNQIYQLFQGRIFHLGKVGIQYNLATEITGIIIIICIIGLSSFMVLNSDLKLGAMMAIVQMMAILIPSTGRLAMTNIQLQEARVAFERMYEFTSLQPEYLPEKDSKKINIDHFDQLKVRDLGFRFPGRERLLDGISFELQKGEMVSILGESGCGKTTSLQILQGFFAFESGDIQVNGLTWDQLSMHAWRELIGVIPQDIKIFNGNLLYNICLGDIPEDDRNFFNFIQQIGLHDYFIQFPQGYNTVLGENGINISEGQKQLVAFARALYRKPKLLLLDEPTSAMDRRTEGKMLDLLQRLKSDIGILLITHKITVAKKTDRIYVMEKGKILAQGSHDVLMKGHNLYSEFWKEL